MNNDDFYRRFIKPDNVASFYPQRSITKLCDLFHNCTHEILAALSDWERSRQAANRYDFYRAIDEFLFCKILRLPAHALPEIIATLIDKSVTEKNHAVSRSVETLLLHILDDAASRKIPTIISPIAYEQLCRLLDRAEPATSHERDLCLIGCHLMRLDINFNDFALHQALTIRLKYCVADYNSDPIKPFNHELIYTMSAYIREATRSQPLLVSASYINMLVELASLAAPPVDHVFSDAVERGSLNPAVVQEKQKSILKKLNWADKIRIGAALDIYLCLRQVRDRAVKKTVLELINGRAAQYLVLAANRPDVPKQAKKQLAEAIRLYMDLQKNGAAFSDPEPEYTPKFPESRRGASGHFNRRPPTVR